jgi:hypothetical protein
MEESDGFAPPPLGEKTIQKVIFVPGKLVTIVVHR